MFIISFQICGQNDSSLAKQQTDSLEMGNGYSSDFILYGNGFNVPFNLGYKGDKNFHISIYNNSSGQQVFETNDTKKVWDGEPGPKKSNEIIAFRKYFYSASIGNENHKGTITVNNNTYICNNSLIDSLLRTNWQFIVGEVQSIKKAKVYLVRWHNFKAEECYRIKIKIINPLNSPYRKSQIIEVISNDIVYSQLSFNLKEKYLICFKPFEASLNSKSGTYLGLWEKLPTTTLVDGKEYIEAINITLKSIKY